MYAITNDYSVVKSYGLLSGGFAVVRGVRLPVIKSEPFLLIVPLPW